ncbi:type II CAAX prenyl endopeptidase Rce1 family protein [Chloroflexota bacterium]
MMYKRRVEPWVLLVGLYSVTLLYYTRQPIYQIFAFVVMLGVAWYWNRSIRHGNAVTAETLKLKSKHLVRDVLLALGLSVFGWYYFNYYVTLTRGTPLTFGYGGSILAVVTIVVVASAEELFFRGYLQNKLNPDFNLLFRALIAVTALALYKNAVHFWEGLPLILHLELFFIGVLHNILSSLWMEWSDSLVGPLLLHVVWDLLVYAPLETIPYWVF